MSGAGYARLVFNRRSGGTVFGGCFLGGRSAMRSVVAAVTRRTARSNVSFVRSDGAVTPLILRTYWRAAASISSGVASGSSPRNVVMLRHMAPTLLGTGCDGSISVARCSAVCQHLRMTSESQRWKVGNATITSVVEDETHHIPPEFFFPAATAAEVAEHASLVPDFADEHGNIALRVQAFVIEIGLRRMLVDPCVGNNKKRPLPFWNEMTWPFFERFTEAGFDAAGIDTVVHTHLHVDHVGWDTHLVDGDWVPTFTKARHLYTERELAYCKAGGDPGIDGVYDDTVAPILAAGLADIVDDDADLGDGFQLEPSTGHTPGHVSMWIESSGRRALDHRRLPAPPGAV